MRIFHRPTAPDDEGSLKIFYNSPLSRICTFKIGGTADAVVIPRNISALLAAIRAMRRADTRYRVIGAGSNVLFSDSGFRGAIIRTNALNSVTVNGAFLTAECGVRLPKLCRIAAQSSLGGLQGLCGIPGTVGGALMTGAGAFGCNIYDHLTACTVYYPHCDRTERIEISATAFSYRRSPFSTEKCTLLSAEFKLPIADNVVILDEMSRLSRIRESTQPCDQKSAGSYFRRTLGAPPTALLIEKAALKGTSVGGARISEKHCGFIINTGSATANEVLELADLVKQRVNALFGVCLEEEVIYIPEI